ncbi:MMPL family transporter [Actinomadura roseirufa]|uniref:MMPL family transporter n=1 Tax=Actinomadura roseirufa TaxID=2094049 RepID=UPI001040F34D|nr:MMPL family transporter [Actinomadura roseirufa]
MLRTVMAWPSGRWAKWGVLVFWLVAVAALAPLGGKLTDVQKNDMSAWLPANAESTKALKLSEDFREKETIPTLIIYDRASGVTPADLAKAKADTTAFTSLPEVQKQVVGPIPSKDGKAIQTIVTLKIGDEGWGGLSKTVDKMIDAAEKGGGGLRVHATGPGGYAADSGKIFTGGDKTLMFATVGIVVLILLFTYRSPLLWLLPLITAGLSLGSAQGLIYLLAKNAGLTVNAQSSFILTVLVFGAATDYALLLIARYREELRRHEDRHEAMAEALHRSGPAIVASAATVAVSLLVLTLAELQSTKGLGPVCAVGIGVGLLGMMTLLPALLVIFGRWMFWPVRPTFGSAEPTEGGLWARVGRRVSVRPRLVWVVTAVVLGVFALGMLDLKADGIAQKDSYTKTTQAVTGEEIQAAHFPAGSGQPVVVIANAAAAGEVKTRLAGIAGVGEVTEPVVKNGHAYIEGTLDASADSKDAEKTVEKVRTELHTVSGAAAKVGGGTALKIDVDAASAHDVKLIIPVVLLVVFGILALLLRSLLAPLLLIVTVVLSFGATLGVSAVVFDKVFGFTGADTSFPLWAFVFLVALGIDYNIFLVTRVREEAMTGGTRRGALTGLAATGGVITSAGLVLAGTFGALGSMPLVFTAEIGFAVAFGVLLDTIIVRSVLVTALTLDIGRHMWWPSALGKRRDSDPPAGEDELRPAMAGQ